MIRSNNTILVIYKDGQSIGSLSLTEEEDIKLWKRLVRQANLTQSGLDAALDAARKEIGR